MKRNTPFLLTGTAAFGIVVLMGGLWFWVARAIPGGGTRPGAVVAVVGGLFCVAFMWLLIHRLRRLLANPDKRWLELALLLLNFTVLILAFAWVHMQIGLWDVRLAGPEPSHRFLDALYFSVITITTVGYGDFIPLGIGRAIAAMQGLIGYFILGILVSTGFQLIAPSSDAGSDNGREDGREEAETERARHERERRSRQAAGADGG